MATTHPNPDRARPTRRTRIGPRAAGVAMSAEEFDAAPASAWDGRFRYELIRRVLVVSPPAGAAERGPGFLLLTDPRSDAEEGSFDGTWPEQAVPGNPNRLGAARVIWADFGRSPDPSRDLPGVVVAFVSRSRRGFVRDDQEEREEYRAAGFPGYWIIDRLERIMKVFRTAPDGPEERTAREGEVSATDLLPGFERPISRLPAVADRREPASPRNRTRPAGGI